MESFWHDISWVLPFRNEGLTAIFKGFTWLGYPTFLLFFLPFFYWTWNKAVATRLMVLVVLTIFLNGVLKDYWMNPRPDAAFRLDPGVGETFGMPSGHAQIAAVLWLWLAYEIGRTWAWGTAIFVVLMICLSRIYLGVHDMEDIVVGLGFAVASMLLFRFFLTSRFAPFRQLKAHWHMIFVAVLGGILVMIWPQPRQSYEAIVLCVLLMAWLLGAHWDRRYIGFQLRETLWDDALWPRILAGLLGVVSLLLFSTLVSAALGNREGPGASLIQLSLLGLYMTAGAPLLFKVVGLNQETNTEGSQ